MDMIPVNPDSLVKIVFVFLFFVFLLLLLFCRRQIFSWEFGLMLYMRVCNIAVSDIALRYRFSYFLTTTTTTTLTSKTTTMTTTHPPPPMTYYRRILARMFKCFHMNFDG